MSEPAPKQGVEAGAMLSKILRRVFLAPVYLYRYTLSAFMGRTCRHMPSCSEYMIEAVEKHGVWPGGWMGFARICRCRPGGTSGLDFVCEELPREARWFTPWRYGLWRVVNDSPAQSSLRTMRSD